MTSFFTAVALAVSFAQGAPPAVQSTPDKITKQTITSGGQPRTYYLYVPPASGAAPLPLIVMLHGSGRRGDLLLNAWKGLAKKEGIILVGPDSSDPKGWSVPVDGPDFIHDVVEAVKQAERVDPRRMFVFGHSAGAVFGLDMGLLESKYFAAVAVSAGAFRVPEDFTPIQYATRKIPFAVIVGKNDQFFPLADVHATRDAFVKAGLQFDLTEIPGHDHNYYARADAINKMAWAFLARYTLDADPEYAQYAFK